MLQTKYTTHTSLYFSIGSAAVLVIRVPDGEVSWTAAVVIGLPSTPATCQMPKALTVRLSGSGVAAERVERPVVVRELRLPSLRTMWPSLAASRPAPTVLPFDADTIGHALTHWPVHDDWGLIGLSLSKKYSVMPLPSVRMVPKSLFAADERAAASEWAELLATVASERVELLATAFLAALLPHAATRNTSASNKAPRDLVADRANMRSSLREFQLIGTTTGSRSFQQALRP